MSFHLKTIKSRSTTWMSPEYHLILAHPKLSQKKGQKVRYCSSGRKGQITVIGCGNATGKAIPPFIIFDGKKVNNLWLEGEFPGSSYGTSEFTKVCSKDGPGKIVVQASGHASH